MFIKFRLKALVNALDLAAFVALVTNQVEQSYTFGTCFYMNAVIATFTLMCSLVLYLDDFMNGYRKWKLKHEPLTSQKAVQSENMVLPS